MADITFDPTGAATIIRAAADIIQSICNVISTNRQTMTPEARQESDHIMFQAYWDWRNLLAFFHIVGAPIPWPPTPATVPVPNAPHTTVEVKK